MARNKSDQFDISIIILSYNTKEILSQCLSSLFQSRGTEKDQVVIVDNGSSDGSAEAVRNFQFSNPNFQIKLIENKSNLGFAKGNNSARKYCRGKYILFLNSDVILERETIWKTFRYLEKHPQVGGTTCKLRLANGQPDKDARRSFPTPWVSFCHFSKLDRLFSKSRIFSQYWYGYLSGNQTHQIDVAQGAYFLLRKKVLDSVNWFDEDYFLDGEDIDLCWKIMEKGWPIIYYPKAKALHLKGASKGKLGTGQRSFEERKKSVTEGVRSMEIFYHKRLEKKYPKLLTILVVGAIKTMSFLRILRIRLEYLIAG